ncbi:class E sortase [Candidatus Curtissbacteria bacterium]|nr:class E sortase [Candidatus Curtissbacteria bacterium]
MTIAIYLKEDTVKTRQLRKRRDRAFFALVAALGLAAVSFAIWPLLVWQAKTLPRLTAKVEQAPIPQGLVLSEKSTLEANVQVVEDPDGFSYFSTNYKPAGPRPVQFQLTIPKLKIKDATVKVDNLNFYTSLSHFPGSALPGDIGNAFITGHSVLPQFADPENYRAIFTELSDLQVGDDIYVGMAGQTFRYVVQYLKVVDPRDLSVLAPISQNGRNLTLMTCVPPGTNTKRLVVITSLLFTK